ncbi:DUF4034 domain-containing protein [Actinokineospora auranticolor]|uniref:DUF4034 domain-containing protein n=1 Tax=Actinokineospora auranticolor TaxID=155976 RepID=A0A2S6GPH0_9PSEU|nr:DUF4034 domain-containing protein [Actinokineospora auranticolor]PPK67063.1 hypothetical protein CLV40_10860 [Actinokineospora auranticolor]
MLLTPKNIALTLRLRKASRRAGVPVRELPEPDLLAATDPRTDPTKWGLPADDRVVTRGPDEDPELTAAVTALREGNWEPAATRLAATWSDWDTRGRVTTALGEAAANDDTWLEAWRAARPDDPGHAVVHARALVSLAWQVRGAGWGSDIAPEQATAFRRLLGDAEPAAYAAAMAAPEDPTPWATLLTIAVGRSWDHDEFEEAWQQLVDRDPANVLGHQSALRYWSARWHGSDDLMTAFAERAATVAPPLAVLPLMAAFELDHVPDAWHTRAITDALDVLLPRLATATESHTTRAERGWAIAALRERGRHPEALDQFRALDIHADAAPWPKYDRPLLAFLQHRRDACRKAGRRHR